MNRKKKNVFFKMIFAEVMSIVLIMSYVGIDNFTYADTVSNSSENTVEATDTMQPTNTVQPTSSVAATSTDILKSTVESNNTVEPTSSVKPTATVTPDEFDAPNTSLPPVKVDNQEVVSEYMFTAGNFEGENIIEKDGINHFIDEEDGTVRVFMKDGITWLKVGEGSTAVWYGFDNSSGYNSNDSFYVRHIEKSKNESEWTSYYNKLDEDYQETIEENKYRIVEIGVVDYQRNKINPLSKEFIVYIQAGDWNPEEFLATEISEGKDTSICTDSVKMKPANLAEELMFGTVTINKSSTFLVYDEYTYQEKKDKITASWGNKQLHNDIEHFISEDGKTSVMIEDDIVWLRETSSGKSRWYGFDNSNGVFEQGSRFWVKELDENENSSEWKKYYNNLDKNNKDKVENDKLCMFELGVTAPDGKEYTDLSKNVKLYVELDSEWDKDDINAVFISDKTDEKVDTAVTNNKDNPERKDDTLFAKLTLEHFSPYAIYDENDITSSDDIEEDTEDTKEKKNTTSTLQNTTDVDTSDELDMTFWLILMALSAVGIDIMYIMKVRKKNNR